MHARSLGHGHRGVDGACLTIFLDVEGTQNAIGINLRVKLDQALVVDHLRFDPENTGHRGGPAQLFQALVRSGQRNAANAPVTRGLPGFLFQGRVEFMTVFGQTGQIRGRPEHADETGRMPCAATGKLFALE